MKNSIKILILTALAFAPVVTAHAQIIFSVGSSDAFDLDYINSGKGDDQLASVVASGVGLLSSTSGTDLSNYATLTGGAEAVGYSDGSTSLGVPNYGGGTNAISATFNFEAASGSTFSDLTVNPYQVVITDNTDESPSVSLAISINGGTFTTFYSSNQNSPTGPGTIDLASYITPGTTDIKIAENDVIADQSYNGLFNRTDTSTGGTNFAVTANVVTAPEPSACALMALGFGALVFIGCRRLAV